MLDPEIFRKDLDGVAKHLAKRGYSLDIAKLAELEKARKVVQVQTQELQSQRNATSKTIGMAKRSGQDIAPLLAKVSSLGGELKQSEAKLLKIQGELEEIMLSIPNLIHETVPTGNSAAENREERRWEEPRKFEFEPKDHVDIGQGLKMMDFELSSKLAGSRFVTMRNDLVKLHRALAHFMIDLHTTEHGYEEVYVPFIVNADTLRGTGQLPKFGEDLFRLAESNYFLIPTAEVPVTNFAQDQIFEADELPRRYVCHTPCFRSEAGSYGKDTRGMLRQHQFEKVELVHLVSSESSYDELELLTGHAELVLQKLELPYRVVTLCSADIGFGAAKTYDIEVWLPGQGQYREISSCSNCESFQARRMKARWRNPATGKLDLIHTLNGSGVAIGRAMIAVMENYQTAEGHIQVPKVLQQYMNGQVIIKV